MHVLYVIADRTEGLVEGKSNIQISIYAVKASADSSLGMIEHLVNIRRFRQLVDDSVVAQPTFFVGKVFVPSVKSHPSSCWESWDIIKRHNGL